MEAPFKLPIREWFDVLIAVGILVLILAFLSPYAVAPRLNVVIFAFGMILLGVSEKGASKIVFSEDDLAYVRRRVAIPLNWLVDSLAIAIMIYAVSVKLSS